MQGALAAAGLVEILFVLAVAGAAAVVRADDDPRLKADLESVSRRRILFGHQSVGKNIIDGLAQLASSEGITLRIVEAVAGPIAPGTFAHVFVAENGHPDQKLESFQRSVDALTGPDVDIALVKFCYVDFTEGTDVATLFARYQDVLGRLRTAHPGTTFVHVTAPLTTVQSGPKALAKRLLGRAPYGTVENVRREQFNALLRQAYRGREPIFDLARVESTAPDRKVQTVEWKGKVAPSLCPAYTDDGGHLNREGQRRAARELLSVLASVPESPGLIESERNRR